MKTLGNLFIAALLKDGSVEQLLKFGKIEHLFKASEVELFEFVIDHARKYHDLPEIETVEAHLGVTLVEANEPAAYYLDLMQARHVEHTLKKGMKMASDMLMPETKDPHAALEAIAEAVHGLKAQAQSHLVVDFRDSYDVVMGEYKQKFLHGDEYGIQFGWKTLDSMSGGLTRGDVGSFVGRPAMGKTWQMLYCARYSWWHQEAIPLFVSMEMPPIQLQQRLSAMQASVPMTKLKNAELSSKYMGKLKAALTEVKGWKVPFWIVDGNFTATVEDIHALALQLKPDSIWIDGGYLVKHPIERDRYRRVAENADLIKQELAPIAPTVCSWQFARSASKKKKGENVTGDDVGYSDAIFQVSSLMMGLFEEESVETLKQRRIEILKGRHGETGQFVTKWDFHKMDFSEVEEESLEDLQFV